MLKGFLLLLLVSSVSLANEESVKANPAACSRDLIYLVGRDPIAHAKVVDGIRAHKPDPLIADLEIEHILGLRTSAGGYRRWYKFYPFWIFDSPSTLEKVLEHFDPSDESAPRYSHGYAAWAKEWETFYDTHLGDVSELWSRNHGEGRRRFIQRLLVEGAVRYTVRLGRPYAPGFFSTQEGTEPFLIELNAGIAVHFAGDTERFQREFDSRYRRVTGGRATGVIDHAVAETRSALRAQGVDLKKLRDWKPVVEQSFRDRRAEKDIELALESVRAFGESKVSLAGLFKDGTAGAAEAQTTFRWEAATEIFKRHGGIEGFVRELNERLANEGLPAIYPALGAQTLAQEMAVQVATTYAVEIGGRGRGFKGFQADQPNEALYVDMGSELLGRSGLDVRRLNLLVLERLP